jgi:hypothetical protein
MRQTNQASADLPKLLTLPPMSLGYGVFQLDVTIVNTALNSIGSALGGGVSEQQWVVSAYTIYALAGAKLEPQCQGSFCQEKEKARHAGLDKGGSDWTSDLRNS